ncbi:hypothetical protein [Helicobacter pylori]|uniref:hypothetical protein n=1 Tax=Helicobacter pylori TaxID=210 RepID=UPI001E610300|nr:hypothetical protein [Helicobacter pylori]
MIVLKNAQSLFKRVSVSHQASDHFLITACERPKSQGQTTHKETPKFFRLRERS